MTTIRLAYATAPDTLTALTVAVALIALVSLLIVVANLRRA